MKKMFKYEFRCNFGGPSNFIKLWGEFQEFPSDSKREESKHVLVENGGDTCHQFWYKKNLKSGMNFVEIFGILCYCTLLQDGYSSFSKFSFWFWKKKVQWNLLQNAPLIHRENNFRKLSMKILFFCLSFWKKRAQQLFLWKKIQ